MFWFLFVRFILCFGVRMSGANTVVSIIVGPLSWVARVWAFDPEFENVGNDFNLMYQIKMASTSGDYAVNVSWPVEQLSESWPHSFLLTCPWNVEFCTDILQEQVFMTWYLYDAWIVFQFDGNFAEKLRAFMANDRIMVSKSAKSAAN